MACFVTAQTRIGSRAGRAAGGVRRSVHTENVGESGQDQVLNKNGNLFHPTFCSRLVVVEMLFRVLRATVVHQIGPTRSVIIIVAVIQDAPLIGRTRATYQLSVQSVRNPKILESQTWYGTLNSRHSVI